jgi:AcrR family transcriptional regulator
MRRRERVRNATVAEIKQLAWAQVAAGGALAVSLRAIARDMGMTSSAIYRYFASLDQLLEELVSDGFASLGDALEAAEAGMDAALGAGERWMQVARAHRRWALDHATEYALIFGRPIPSDELKAAAKQQHDRSVAVLFRVMIAGIDRGSLDPAILPALSAPLQKQLGEWQHKLGLPLDVRALAGCLFAWSHLHGAVQLELFGQLPPALVPADELFDQHMRATLQALGCSSVPGPARP